MGNPVHFSWNRLYSVMYKRMMSRFEAHNALCFPTQKEQSRFGLVGPSYRRSFVKRVKPGEIETARNILKLYCQQVASDFADGRLILTNIVKANSQSARNNHSSSSGTDRHLGKLALAGLLLGTSATVKSAKVYQDALKVDGAKGYGVKPIKRYAGKYSDYSLLIDPDLIPTNILPKGVTVLFAEYFSTPMPAFQPPLRAKIESLEVLQSEGNQKIKELLSKASIFVDKPGEIIENEAISNIEGTKIEVSQSEKTEGNPTKANEKEVAAARLIEENARKRVKNRDFNEKGLFQKLYLNGQELAAYAILMIQLYIQKIAKAEGKAYVSAEIERGKQAVISNFLQYDPKDWDQLSARYTMVIDHMAKWVALDDKNWIKPPSKWFDPQEPGNIEGAERLFLRRFEKEGKLMQQVRSLQKHAKSAKSDGFSPPKKLGAYELQAKILKNNLLLVHPADRRLKSADLIKWAHDLRLLVQKDRFQFDDLTKTLDWFCHSKSPNARFWRENAGFGKGIRSAQGFRRNFKEMNYQRVRNVIYAAQHPGRVKSA